MLTPNSLRKEKDPAAVGVTKISRAAAAGSFSPFNELDLTLGAFTVPGRPGGERLSPENQVIQELRRQVTQLRTGLARLQRDLPERDRASREKGRIEGRTEGAAAARTQLKAEGEEKINRLQKNFASVLRAWEQEKDKFYREAEGVGLEIVRQLAGMVLHREITTDPQVVLGTLKAALRYASERTTLTIKVNPRDFPTVTGQRQFWQPINSQLKNVQVEEDERVEAGGCLVDTGAGTIDARIDSQFQKLREIMEQAFNKQNSEPSPPPADQKLE